MEKDLRMKIADVIEKDLPWTEEDLLDLADKIIAVLPKLSNAIGFTADTILPFPERDCPYSDDKKCYAPPKMPIIGGRVPDVSKQIQCSCGQEFTDYDNRKCEIWHEAARIPIKDHSANANKKVELPKILGKEIPISSFDIWVALGEVIDNQGKIIKYLRAKERR